MPLGLTSTSYPSITRDNRADYQSNESEEEEGEEEEEGIKKQLKKQKPRPPRYPRPHSHLYFSPTTGRMLKGNRHTKRYHNSLFLKTLFPLSEEELTEDYHRIAPDYRSAFTEVLTNNHKHSLWESFNHLSEEEQFDLLMPLRSSRKDQPPPIHLIDKRDKDLERIDRHIRSSLFHDKRLSKGFMESIEKELYDYFLDDPLYIIIYLNLTSYHRMLIHAVCQYNSYVSKTYHVDGLTSYLMISCDHINIPSISLFKSLQNRRTKIQHST